MKLSFLSLKFIFNLLKGKITNRLNAVLACLFVKKFHKKVYFHKVYFYYWSFKALKVANIFNLLYGIAKKNYNLHTFMIFFNKCFQSDGTKTVLCNKILELLLDSLCSKTLSAPSFGHYWKQMIGNLYSIVWICICYLGLILPGNDDLVCTERTADIDHAQWSKL